VGHVMTSELSPVGRQGLEPRDAWQHRSPPQWGDRVRSHMMCGTVEAHLNREVGSEAEVARGSTPYSLSLLHACTWVPSLQGTDTLVIQ
jgi:hypothetical protein